jgi:flagellar export protein FliJ
MAVSRALRRLLNIRNIEEEQSHLTLESALGELHRLEYELEAAAERDRRGRRLIHVSASTGELPDRLAGLEEMRAAVRRRMALAPRIADAQLDVAALRQEFLAKRVERRQAETLIQETEARDAIEAGRRGQRGLDDWYGSRLHREEAEAQPARPTTSR